MAIKTFTTGEVLTAADTNTYLANPGLVCLSKKTFSAQSTWDMTSIFNSTYDNYRIIFIMSPTPTPSIVQTQLLNGSTPSTTTYSSYEAGNYWAGGADLAPSVSTAYWFGLRSSGVIFATMDILQPSTTNYTSYFSSGVDGDQSWQSRGIHATNTAYNGLRLYNASGNMTGSATIYGYRNG
jgi:hypothetical protein